MPHRILIRGDATDSEVGDGLSIFGAFEQAALI
jgi:hypothetical protein